MDQADDISKIKDSLPDTTSMTCSFNSQICDSEIEVKVNKLESDGELVNDASKNNDILCRSKHLKSEIIEANLLPDPYSAKIKNLPKKLKGANKNSTKCIESNLLTNFVFNTKVTVNVIGNEVDVAKGNLSEHLETLQNTLISNNKLLMGGKCTAGFISRNNISDNVMKEKLESEVQVDQFSSMPRSDTEINFNNKSSYQTSQNSAELSVIVVDDDNSEYASSFIQNQTKKNEEHECIKNKELNSLTNYLVKRNKPTASENEIIPISEAGHTGSGVQQKIINDDILNYSNSNFSEKSNPSSVSVNSKKNNFQTFPQNVNDEFVSCDKLVQNVCGDKNIPGYNFNNETAKDYFIELEVSEVHAVNIVNSSPETQNKNISKSNLNHESSTTVKDYGNGSEVIEVGNVTNVISSEKNKKGRKNIKKTKCMNLNTSNSLTNYFVTKSKSPSSEKEDIELGKNIEHNPLVINVGVDLQSESDSSKTFVKGKNVLIQSSIDTSTHELTMCKETKKTMVVNSIVGSEAGNKKPNDAKPGRKNKRQKRAISKSLPNNVLSYLQISPEMCKKRKKGQIEADGCPDLDGSNLAATSTDNEPQIPEVVDVESPCETQENVNSCAGKSCSALFGTGSQVEISKHSTKCNTAKFTVERNIRKKYKQIKSLELGTVLEAEVQTISERRRSLRSRGLRIDLNSSMRESDEKQNRNVNKQIKGGKNKDKKDVGEAVQENMKAFETVSVKETKAQRKRNKTKKEKSNLKLFPIFSNSNTLSAKTLKRKVEETKGYADPVQNKNIKKTKGISKRNKTESNKKLEESICNAKEKKFSHGGNNPETSIIDIKSDSCNADQSEILVVENVIYKPDGSKLNLELKRTTRETDKQKFWEEHLICFPLFSHTNVCDKIYSASSKVCRFTINEDIQSEVVTPDWKDNIGLIHPQDIRMLKAKLESVPKKCKNHITEMRVLKQSLLWTDSTDNKLNTEPENCETIKEIKSWLLQWKNKFNDCSKVNNHNKDDYFPSDSEEDCISNSIIISGAPGTGKTSIVFSIAKELGFTVLEVNASSCRNGRNISNQLKEALESYHMESIKIDNFRKDTVLDKAKNEHYSQTIKNVDTTKTKGIKSFFTANTSPSKKNNALQKEKNIANFFHSVNKDVEKQSSKSASKMRCKTNNESECLEKTESDIEKNSCKISGLTIILFDDVDVVFDEDEGFWSTVKGFLKISKKPVIFTVGRNLSIVKSILNDDIQVFHMKPSSKEVAVKVLQENCREHSRENSRVNLELLTSHNVCDIRRNILNAQFWTQLPMEFEDKRDLVFNSPNPFNPMCVNSFITGDVQFSTDPIQTLLFGAIPNSLSSTVMEYHSLGYDILFNNIFKILYDLKNICRGKLWKEWTLKFQNGSSRSHSFLESEMWKEACAVFEQKKKALKSGSKSQELEIFAEALGGFSLADTLKGSSHCPFQLLSISQRIKLWSAGQPVCLEQNFSTNENLLNIISLIHIYHLRKAHSLTTLKYSDTNDRVQLELEHPLFNFDNSLTYKAEDELENISLVLPSSYLLNKSTLILDYLSTIKIMSQNEETRQLKNGKRCGRFLHYFDSISLYIDRKRLFV